MIVAVQVARRHASEYCQGTLGYKTANMHFVEGHIELLDRAGIQDESVDIVISNCVVNLSPDKPRVLEQVCAPHGMLDTKLCMLFFWNRAPICTPDCHCPGTEDG